MKTASLLLHNVRISEDSYETSYIDNSVVTPKRFWIFWYIYFTTAIAFFKHCNLIKNTYLTLHENNLFEFCLSPNEPNKGFEQVA